MVTLGINYSQMHDSSACLVRDGELLFAVAEERISRVKHDARFPALVDSSLPRFRKVRPDQVEEVCVGWQTPGATYRHDLKLYLTGQWPMHLSKRTEFHAAFRQYVAPERRRKSLHAPVRFLQGSLSLCGSSSGARDQRLFLLRLR